MKAMALCFWKKKKGYDPWHRNPFFLNNSFSMPTISTNVLKEAMSAWILEYP